MAQRNQTDATLRNVRAAKKRELTIQARVTQLEQRLTSHVDQMVSIIQDLRTQMDKLSKEGA